MTTTKWTKTTDAVTGQQTWTRGDLTIVRSIRGISRKTSFGRSREINVSYCVYRGEVRVKNQIGDESTLAAAKALVE